MSIPEVLNILLFFIHLCALLTSVAVIFYFLSVWLSGRFRSEAVFPFPEIELGSKILGVSLTSLWLSALPSALLGSLSPDRYFSFAGIVLLACLTVISSLTLYLVLEMQERVTKIQGLATNASIHAGFRIAAAAETAVLILVFLLLMPSKIFPSTLGAPHPDEILPELLSIFLLLFALIFAITTVLKNSWLDRSTMTT